LPDYQLTVSDGTRIGFTDDRELDQIIEQVIEEGFLRISGERTIVDEAAQIEGDYVAFENHIVSIST
jgi:ABC-type xylose transport system substrate-binding protein